MGLKRTLADPEHVAALTSQDLSYQAAAVAGATDDLLDRHAVLGQSEDSGVGVLAAQVALVLDALGGRQEVRVDRHGADGSPDLTHRLADRVEESAAGVLHQMPAICDLDSVRQRLGCGQGIGAAPVAGDDGDLGLLAQPCLGRGRLAIGKEADGAARSRSQMIVP